MKAKKSLENFFTFILIILLIVALIIEPLKNLKLKELAKFDKIIQNIEDYKSTYYQYPQKINLKYNNVVYNTYNDNQDFILDVEEDAYVFYSIYKYCSEGVKEKCEKESMFKFGDWYYNIEFD